MMAFASKVWLLSVTRAIDRPKSVPQLLWNRMCISIFYEKNVQISNLINFFMVVRYLIVSWFLSDCKILVQTYLWFVYGFRYSCRAVFIWLHNCCGGREGWDPVHRFNHTIWLTVVIPTDRPKAVRNSCVIAVFGWIFVVSFCVLELSECKGFCHRTVSDLFIFLLWKAHRGFCKLD